jgi:hypothetical protein
MTGPAEPTLADLAAIEAEWPVIEAELDVLAAEIRLLTATAPAPLDWRRLRRAERRVLAARRRPAPPPVGADMAGVAS